MFEEPDAVGKERNIEGNDKSAVSNDSLWAEGAGDYRIAEKSLDGF